MMVEAPGIQAEHETSSDVVPAPGKPEETATVTTPPDDVGRRSDPDAALWAAIDAATAARDAVRVAALTAELQRRPAPVLVIVQPRGR